MITTFILTLLITFILGFRLGKAFILKGLTLRISQLYEEGDYQKAKFIEMAMERYEEDNNESK